MKKTVLNLGLVFLSLITLESCKDDVMTTLPSQQVEKKGEKELICFPKYEGNTRSGEADDDWEKWEKVILPSGLDVLTPWNQSLTASAIPLEIRQDIKRANGWELIAHTMKGYGDKGMNYLFFHNRYTGLLKVFYFLEQDVSQLQNTGMWKLHFESPQSFLNFTGEFAKPASFRGDTDFYVENITNDESRGFLTGWNCFQVELAYDPNFTSIPLQIIPYNMNVTDLKFDGTFESSTSGTIIQAYAKNIFDKQIKAVAGYAGDKAEKWVKEGVEKGAFKKIKNLVVNGAGSIVTSGVSSLLHGFLGGFNKQQNTIQTVQLRTNGSCTLTGKMTEVTTGIMMPLSIRLSADKVGKLGAWCLEEEPVFELSPIAHLEIDSSEGEEVFLKKYYLENWNLIYKAKINPDLASHIKECKFTYTLFESEECNHGTAFEYNNHSNSTFITKNFLAENKLYEKIYSISDIPVTIHVGLVDTPPQSVYVINAPDGTHGGVGNIQMNKFHLASVAMELKVEIDGEENTFVSSHMFDINKYQWSPWDDGYKSYWPFTKK